MGRRRQYVQRIQVSLTQELKHKINDLIGNRQTPFQYFIEETIYKLWEEKYQQRDKRFKSSQPSIFPRSVTSPDPQEEDQYSEEDDGEWVKDPFTELRDKILYTVPPEEQHHEDGRKLAYLSEAELKIWVYQKAEEYDIPLPQKEPTEAQLQKQEKEQQAERERTEKHDKEWEENERKTRELKKIKAFRWRCSKNPKLKKQKIWGDIRVVAPHLVAKYSKDPQVRILKTSKELQNAEKEIKELFEWVAKKETEYAKKYGEGTPEYIRRWNSEIDPE